MIKLLWNTQNQNISNPNNPSYKDSEDYNWGVYHKNNSDKWIFEILNKKTHTLDHKFIDQTDTTQN